jgi:hypothetical protein
MQTKRPLLRGLLNAPKALLLSESCREREEEEKEEDEGKEERQNTDDRSIIISQTHRRLSSSKVSRFYLKSVAEFSFFPFKKYQKYTQQTTKKKSIIGNQRIHPLCHTAFTYTESKSLL